MLRQYLSIKDEYPDAILFFRMGDFYEMFFDDAQSAARVLGITLTSRGSHEGEKIPMCGVPHHASKSYIAKLVDNGWKVAICDQVEDPKKKKGIVERRVTRIVTPGSIIDERDLDFKSNLYTAAISASAECFGMAHVDLLTGDFRVTEVSSWQTLLDELDRIDPAELLVLEQDQLQTKRALSQYRVEILGNTAFDPSEAENLLREQLGVRSLAGFGCHGMDQGIRAAGSLVYYLRQTQKANPGHIKEIVTYHLSDFMFLDEATRVNLELLKTMRRHSVKGSLLQILDKTTTPMGSRLLKQWISYPLIKIDQIRKRLAAVACLKDEPLTREELKTALKDVYDLERLNGRIALKRANARDLLALASSVRIIPDIKRELESSVSTRLSVIAEKLDILDDIADLIADSIHENPPASVTEGGIIRSGYNEELDRLICLSRDGKSWIRKFALEEQRRTGISSLKAGYNKVYGYYLEISKANLHLVPQDYIRKQTLVNGERYVTEDLKIMEEQILGAEEKRIDLERRIFEEIVNRIGLEHDRIKTVARYIAEIDVFAGLAEAAEFYHYCCPEVIEGANLEILDGRHPVIEQTVKDEDFVPNDLKLDEREQQVLIITGPNMAGKSTILRQTALSVLMAQMGSFVPASKAIIGCADRIFTRVGASDDIAQGQSTFMVEMNETANILRHASPQSLVVLDEIGRGTSTYDGLSIAWAVAEALHDLQNRGVRTLFATHYHELTELVATKSRVKNYNIAVKEWDNKIIFLRKLIPGGASRSYGIQVARIAGVPEEVLKRAEEILSNLEMAELDAKYQPRLAHSESEMKAEESRQLSLFQQENHEIIDWIRKLDISLMSPLEALIELNRLREYVCFRGNSD
jgi:DNA mismatch repair protein MutS